MKYQSLQSLSIALILFSLGQIAFGQDLVPPFDNATLTELATQSSTPVEGREEREQRREDRQNRRKPIDPLPDDPIPDQNEGEGESVSPANPDNPDADLTIEPIEGREERERRRRERERKQREKEEREREQEEYDRAHPKPQKLGFVGWIWSWTFGPILSVLFWPFSWIASLIKWGGIFMLITMLVLLLAFGILCGLTCGYTSVWIVARVADFYDWLRRPKDQSP